MIEYRIIKAGSEAEVARDPLERETPKHDLLS